MLTVVAQAVQQASIQSIHRVWLSIQIEGIAQKSEMLGDQRYVCWNQPVESTGSDAQGYPDYAYELARSSERISMEYHMR